MTRKVRCIVASPVRRTRRPLTDAGLARAFVTYPLLTLKVIAGIHWEALRLWLKGIRLRRHPPPPQPAITFGHPVDAKETSRRMSVEGQDTDILARRATAAPARTGGPARRGICSPRSEPGG